MSHALVLRHHEEDHIGLVGDALSDRGWSLSSYLVVPGMDWPPLEAVDLVVVLGSKSSVYDPEVTASWFGEEMTYLRLADAQGIAILGVCFGAQALCLMSRGSVGPAPRGEVGWLTVSIHDADVPRGPWFAYHDDHCHLPPNAELLGATPEAVQIFAIGRHFGVQFHPEVDGAQLRGWFAAGLDPRSETPEALRDCEFADLQIDTLRSNVSQLVAAVLANAGLN